MKRININNVEATLDLTTWTCRQPGLLKVLKTYTEALDVGGHVPDVEEFVLAELSKKLTFTVVAQSPKGDDPPDEVF